MIPQPLRKATQHVRNLITIQYASMFLAEILTRAYANKATRRNERRNNDGSITTLQIQKVSNWIIFHYGLYIIMDMREFCAYAWLEWSVIIDRLSAGLTYHRLDVGMRNSVKFVILQFIIRAYVDVCSFILGTIAVLGC